MTNSTNSTNSTNNMMLYIKRAEQHQTKDFIINMFSYNKIGEVSDVNFIKKNDTNGRDYNGAIVTFKHWHINILVKNLLNQMSTSPDGTTRFTYDSNKGRYWIINVYKTQILEIENQQILSISPTLTDKERILELEKMVKSMEAQLYYAQTKQEKTERQLMKTEHDDTQTRLINMDLKYQMEAVEREKEWAEENQKKELLKLKDENDVLKCQNICLTINLNSRNIEWEQFKLDLYDEKCIEYYMKNQEKEKQDMLEETYMTILTIEELM